MATGYTYAVVEGRITTFNEFARECARAFGALITMRDDPAGTEIPEEFKPDISHYDENISQDLENLENLLRGDCEITRKMYKRDMDYERKHFTERREKAKLAVERCENILKRVREWNPPTHEHINMKDFMIEQLESTIKFDGISESEMNEKFREKPFQQWLKETTAATEKSILWSRKHKEEEIDRCKKRTEWVKDLRESLKPFQNE